MKAAGGMPGWLRRASRLPFKASRRRCSNVQGVGIEAQFRVRKNGRLRRRTQMSHAAGIRYRRATRVIAIGTTPVIIEFQALLPSFTCE